MIPDRDRTHAIISIEIQHTAILDESDRRAECVPNVIFELATINLIGRLIRIIAQTDFAIRIFLCRALGLNKAQSHLAKMLGLQMCRATDDLSQVECTDLNGGLTDLVDTLGIWKPAIMHKTDIERRVSIKQLPGQRKPGKASAYDQHIVGCIRYVIRQDTALG